MFIYLVNLHTFNEVVSFMESPTVFLTQVTSNEVRFPGFRAVWWQLVPPLDSKNSMKNRGRWFNQNIPLLRYSPAA